MSSYKREDKAFKAKLAARADDIDARLAENAASGASWKRQQAQYAANRAELEKAGQISGAMLALGVGLLLLVICSFFVSPVACIICSVALGLFYLMIILPSKARVIRVRNRQRGIS